MIAHHHESDSDSDGDLVPHPNEPVRFNKLSNLALFVFTVVLVFAGSSALFRHFLGSGVPEAMPMSWTQNTLLSEQEFYSLQSGPFDSRAMCDAVCHPMQLANDSSDTIYWRACFELRNVDAFLCAPTPCEHGGKWISESSHCECSYGWSGPTCALRCGHGSINETGWCECDEGWTGASCFEDIDECAALGDPDWCVNEPGTFRARCDSGWAWDSSNEECVDKDECMDGGRCVDGSVCINTPGSFLCGSCTGNTGGDPYESCEPLDRCASGTHSCINRHCIPTDDGFECGDCFDGAHPVSDMACHVPDAQPNSPGNYICSDALHASACSSLASRCTYSLSPGTDDIINQVHCGPCSSGFSELESVVWNVNSQFAERSQICSDVNECEEDPCDPLTECSNMYGGYACGPCPIGFKGHGSTGCELIDLCEHMECEDGRQCERNGDEFQCSACPSHFEEDGLFRCRDVDECAQGTDQCASPEFGGKCINTVGGYDCECEEGWHGDGVECTTSCSQCHEEGTAFCSYRFSDSPSQTCTCKPGWGGEWCNKRQPLPCMNGGLWREHDCWCPDGFAGFQCETDVDECALGLHACQDGRDCENTLGSYECGPCPAGFVKHGPLNCVPVNDPCSGVDPCKHHALCIPPSDRHTCVLESRIPACPCENGGSCVEDGRCLCPSGWTGDFCEQHAPFDCMHGGAALWLEGAMVCVCQPGWGGQRCQFALDQAFCLQCENGGSCIVGPGGETQRCLCPPTHGGFYCELPIAAACPFGYEPDAQGNCVNIDECTRLTDPCPSSFHCVDTEGSFKCRCEEGELAACLVEPSECPDDDEAVVCPRDSSCVSVDPLDCACDSSYEEFDGERCVDVDECAIEPSLCPTDSICVNLDPSFACVCEDDLKLFHMGACEPVDPCTPDQRAAAANQCEESCWVTHSNATLCGCSPNEIWNPVTLTCETLNECAMGTDMCPPATSRCVDLDDGYDCECLRAGEWFSWDRGECYVPSNPCDTQDLCPGDSVCLGDMHALTWECVCNDPASYFDAESFSCVANNECEHVTCAENEFCTNLAEGHDCSSVWFLTPPFRSNTVSPNEWCSSFAEFAEGVPPGYQPTSATAVFGQHDDHNSVLRWGDPNGCDHWTSQAGPTTSSNGTTIHCDDELPLLCLLEPGNYLDACVADMDDCPDNARCVHTGPNQFTCECHDPDQTFYESLRLCSGDVDLCELGAHNCPDGSLCVSTGGSAYTCQWETFLVTDVTGDMGGNPDRECHHVFPSSRAVIAVDSDPFDTWLAEAGQWPVFLRHDDAKIKIGNSWAAMKDCSHCLVRSLSEAIALVGGTNPMTIFTGGTGDTCHGWTSTMGVGGGARTSSTSHEWWNWMVLDCSYPMGMLCLHEAEYPLIDECVAGLDDCAGTCVDEERGYRCL